MVSTRQGLSLSQSRSVAPLPILALGWRCTHDFFLYPVFLLVFLCAVQSVQIRSIPPGQKWPGFSFAVQLLRVQGFYFAPLQYSHIQAFTARFAPSMQLYHLNSKSVYRDLQGLFRQFAAFCRRCMAGVSCYAVQPARRWRAYKQAQSASTDTRYHRRTGTLCSSSQPPYYNKVYKGAGVRPLL